LTKFFLLVDIDGLRLDFAVGFVVGKSGKIRGVDSMVWKLRRFVEIYDQGILAHL
jgi:hypothetical protein